MSNRYGDTREQQGQPNERNLSAAGTYCIPLRSHGRT